MADFDTSRKNVKSGRVKIEDRTFQIEFWDDCRFGLPYVSVSEIVTKEVKPYPFSRKRIVKEVEENIDYGWMAVNRLDWALNRIAQYLQREKDKIREMQEIEAFCKKGEW